MNKWKEIIPYIIIIVVVLLVRTYIVSPIRVTGTSMEPTLKEGEIMFLNKTCDINRYDIVVVDSSVEGDNIIKRVIGMPGDSIEVIDGKLYINDILTEDVYGSGETGDFNKVYLGSDEYYVMGDNRMVSLDSRVFGKIKRKTIKGVADFIVYPFNKFGKYDD